MRKIAIAILALFFLLAIAGGILQSPWGREKSISLLADALKNSGVQIEIGEIRGTLPHQVELIDLRIDAEGYEISFGSLKARLSLLRLLKKEITFTDIAGDRVTWIRKPTAPSVRQEGISYLVNVERFQLTNVDIPELFTANLEGALRIGKWNKYGFLDISATRPEYPDSSARLLLSIQRNGTAIGRLDLITPTLEAFPFPLPLEGALSAQCNLVGHWSAFLERRGPLEAKVKGSFHPSSVPILLGNWFERNWTFGGQLRRNGDLTWTLSKLGAKSDFFNIKGSASLAQSGALADAQFQIQSDRLSLATPLPVSGRLFANLNLKEESGAIAFKTTWRIPVLSFKEYQAREVQGSGEGAIKDGALEALARFNANFLSHPWTGDADLSWTSGSSLSIPRYQLQSEPMRLSGALELRQDRLLVGETQFAIEQLHPLHNDLFGSASGKAVWEPIEQNGIMVQALHFDAKGSNFYWENFFSEKIFLYSDLIEPFGALQGTVFADLEGGKIGALSLQSASLETEGSGENWPFKLTAEGEWKHPLSLRADGYWRLKGDDLLISLQNGNGSFFDHPFSLANPASFEWSPETLRLRDFSLQVADGNLAAAFHRRGSETDAKLSIDELPLDFLSVNPLDIAIDGLFNLEAKLHEIGSALEGEFKASIAGMEVETLAQNAPLNANGVFEGTFERDRLDLKGKLEVRKTPLLNLDLSLPVHLRVWPPTAALVFHERAKGKFSLDGHIEDFLDFFDLGSHRLEGECHCNLSLNHTLARPLLSGYIDFDNGSYQNYYTGTELKNIRAEWLADKESLFLRVFSAQDAQQQGTLTAKGRIDMAIERKFPFRFDLDFTRLNLASLDLITAQAGGKLQIEGDADGALARGSAAILEADVTVPDRIPRKYPNLQVVYKNAEKPPEPPQALLEEPYPLRLDLSVDAPDGIFISGRGLDTEWKGSFHIGGTQTAVEAKGSIELIKGEFLFSGRRFKLTEGSLSFSGVPNEMPFLNLAGMMEVKDVAITARLKGPLNNPQITLQSTPPLPMGTIMSYLLFGQDMSEINSLQALQLANSLSSIAGEGPDVLETTRRSLGVDRLRLLNLPSDVEGEGGTVAVQVGKYVTEGVIVSYSQGADYSSGNISIEVEAKGGMTFVLESDQVEEQGKFTLRWSHNY